MLADGIVIFTTWYKLFRGKIVAKALRKRTLSDVLLVEGKIFVPIAWF